MRATVEIAQPDELELRVTVHMTAKDARELVAQLQGGKWPATAFSTILLGAMQKARQAHTCATEVG